MGWLPRGRDGLGVEGYDVARRRFCVTPALRVRLRVSVSGADYLRSEVAQGPEREGLVWGCWDAGLPPI